MECICGLLSALKLKDGMRKAKSEEKGVRRERAWEMENGRREKILFFLRHRHRHRHTPHVNRR